MTDSRYRLVHFVPDPFVGARVPIAAVLDVEGRTSVHRLPHLPGPDCLGSRERSTLMHMILEGLEKLTSFERLPMALGPQVVLDVARDVPRGVNPHDWLHAAFLQSPAPKPAAASHRAPKRATFGYKFFENWNLQRWVHKGFHPDQTIKGFIAKARPLAPVSHYVAGRDEVLLMEPIVPSHGDAKNTARHIATLFGAYKSAMTPAEAKRARLITYMLSGGSAGVRQEIGDMLAGWSDVIDTTVVNRRDALVERVRTVGQSGELTASA